jgi:CHAT domain-containing protein
MNFNNVIALLGAIALSVIFCSQVSARSLDSPQSVGPVCDSALISAKTTAQYFQQGQSARAEAQHRVTMSLLRQLRSLELISCAFDVQWQFPIDGKRYPAYITEYSNLAFEEAIRTKNIETAAQLLAQTAGLYYSKNMFPETMRFFRQFGVFFDPFTAMNVFEDEQEIVRKAQLFKDVSRRFVRFMYRTHVVHRPICEANDCLHLGWEMQEKIKSRLFRGEILKGALLGIDAQSRDRIKGLLLQDNNLRLKRNQFYFLSRQFSGPTPYDRELREVDNQIVAIVPEFAKLGFEISQPEEISRALERNETLLSFFYVDNNIRPVYVWKLERDSPPQIYELSISVEKLFTSIAELKRKIEAGKSIQDIQADLVFLKSKLIDPLKLEPQPQHKLIIASDQNLSSLPFDLMPWGSSTMMLDVFDIRYVPSATVFYFLRSRDVSTESMKQAYKVNYAGFSYRNTGKDELNYADIEIQNAGQGFPLPKLIKKDASILDLHQNSEPIANSRYLHLVTHSSPLEGVVGGFYLPFKPDNAQDGRLTSYQIVRMLKNHAELVVLSACQTALSNENLPPSAFVRVDPDVNGEAALFTGSGCICNYGESFSNLSGSFFAAGSKQLLLTQWLIPDEESTAEFIKRIFDMLREGKTPAEALRLAKQQMRDDHNERFAPVNWAGFILAGS